MPKGTCQFCQKKTGTTPAGLSAHERNCPQNPKKAKRKTRKNPVADQIKVKVELVGWIQEAFPRGIPTNDPDELLRTLDWISQTEGIISARAGVSA
jgi:hypothetical protein